MKNSLFISRLLIAKKWSVNSEGKSTEIIQTEEYTEKNSFKKMSRTSGLCDSINLSDIV